MHKTYERTPEIRKKMATASRRYYRHIKKLGLDPPKKGKKMSPEVCERMSKAHLAYYQSLRDRGIPFPLTGHIIPGAVKLKMSLAKKGKHLFDRHYDWKGGRKRSGNYWMILQPYHPAANSKGYVLEHRLIMEKKLGRFLKPDEIIHHINGNGTDNRIENLRLFKGHRTHSSFHAHNHVPSSQEPCSHRQI